MNVIVDFEGFQLPNRKFIVKELAFFNSDNNERMCYFFKSPKTFRLNQSERRVINWLIKNIHGIEWDYGMTDFHYLTHILNNLTEDCNTILYVKGEEKKCIFEQLTNFKTKIFNLESIGCPKFQDLYYPTCLCGSDRHLSNNHCALKKVIALSTWFRYATYQK